MYNLLTESLIRFDQLDGQRVEASLPKVYAALMADEVSAFPALRPHQRHAWHAFLVQLGTMAMLRAGIGEPSSVMDEWGRLIRGLTPDHPNDEPWTLVVDDITRPAFMQPPASSVARERDYHSSIATPDELDMLVTSKNHDLKSTVAVQAGVDDWLFALISLQTMEGFSGAGNYGISRMNGGLGNRPAFTLAPLADSLGSHVRRDITALLEYRPTLLSEYPMTDRGADLLWILPWDGTSADALTLDRLDPLYIEVCRRIRLCSTPNGRLNAIRANSKAARIEGRSIKGRTGDPWTPVNLSREGLPLTLAGGGFTYRRVAEYLTSPDWMRPALLRPTRSEQDSSEAMRLVARAMVRGQGKTEGYHERSIPIGNKLKVAMLRRDATQELGDIAKARIEEVGKIQRILSHAVQLFVARGDNERISPEGRALARSWLNHLDDIVDTHFFEGLQTEFEADVSQRQGIRAKWLMNGKDGVIDYGRILLSNATDSLPCPAMHRYRARVNAEGLFEGRLRGSSGLPFLFDQENQGMKE